MQSVHSYCYCHHQLSYMGEEEVGNRLLMLGPSKQINKQSSWGELWTIRFPAHAELPGTSGKVVPGEHTAPCPACDNLCFKELASNTLFAWEHMGTANC